MQKENNEEKPGKETMKKKTIEKETMKIMNKETPALLSTHLPIQVRLSQVWGAKW